MPKKIAKPSRKPRPSQPLGKGSHDPSVEEDTKQLKEEGEPLGSNFA